ncbi:MAG: hypothetical protein ABIB93_06390 [Chloroflexota bacterium]
MEYKINKRSTPGWGEVEVLGETFEKGKPALKEKGGWRQKLTDRDEMLSYVRNGERYWYSEEGFGSEKRKNPV